MHDIRLIRENPEAFDAALVRRGADPLAAGLIALDESRRALTTRQQEVQARRNDLSKQVGQAKAAKDEARAQALMAEVSALKDELEKLTTDQAEADEALKTALAAIPNLPAADVPDGADEDDNLLVHTRGEQPVFAFEPREHDAFGPALGLDFETGAQLAGARFTLVRGHAAKLARALGQFMLDTLTGDHGYEEVNPPILVRPDAMFGTIRA